LAVLGLPGEVEAHRVAGALDDSFAVLVGGQPQVQGDGVLRRQFAAGVEDVVLGIRVQVAPRQRRRIARVGQLMQVLQPQIDLPGVAFATVGGVHANSRSVGGDIVRRFPPAPETGRMAQIRSAQRSYSSASTTRTRSLSPGLRVGSAMNTLPSISGASAQERATAPSSSTSSTSTSISVPILRCRRAAEIACWWAMKRSQRSCLISSGTASRPSPSAGAPSTGEYWKQPTRSSCASVSQSSRYWK